MILLVTHKDDYTADFLVNQLNQKGITYYRFNCENILDNSVDFSNDQNFYGTINGVNSFRSVWFRRTKLPALANNLTKEEQSYLFMEYDGLLNNLLQNINTQRWLSHPNYITIAENKMYQLRSAQVIGFNIPETLVTSSKEKIREFASRFNNEIIVKSLSSGRIKDAVSIRLIYTNKLKQEHLADLEQYDITPCIFQEYIEKEYEIRVTVVGDELFAARVNSQDNPNTKIDWRKERLSFVEYKLPDVLVKACISLVKALNLSFGAIDLIKSTNGPYYFLEINPNGQWAWIEMDTSMPISSSIIKFLNS